MTEVGKDLVIIQIMKKAIAKKIAFTCKARTQSQKGSTVLTNTLECKVIF